MSAQCEFRSAAGIRCHRVAGHDGGHKPYPSDWDLPADLAELLADPSYVLEKDAAVWDLIGRYAIRRFREDYEARAALSSDTAAKGTGMTQQGKQDCGSDAGTPA